MSQLSNSSAAMSNEDIIAQLAAMKAQMDAMKADNAAKDAAIAALQAKKGGASNFGEQIRIYKTGGGKGKVNLRYKTAIDMTGLQVLMVASKLKELLSAIAKFKGAKIERRVSMNDKKKTRNVWDDIFAIDAEGNELQVGTVALAKNADNSTNDNWNHPENVQKFEERVSQWNALWAEIETKYGKKS